MSLIHKCLLFPMVGLKIEIFAFIAEKFTLKLVAELMEHLVTWTPYQG